MRLKGRTYVELHAITDGKKTATELVKAILAIADEVDYIHIREKTKQTSEVIQLVEQLLTKGVQNEKLVINDRLDVALLTGIPNVHLPGTGLPVKLVKQKFPEIKVGVSVHSLAEAVIAAEDGADYCLFGHVFPTNSKKGIPGKGTKLLKEIVQKAGIPVLAIGGITPDNMTEVAATKVSGMAVMSAIFSAQNPKQAAKLFRKERD